MAPIAPAQNQSDDCSADRTLAMPASPSPAAPRKTGILEKILVMVGPADDKPLTRKEAFDAYVLSTIGPVPILGEAAGAGIRQWLDSPKEWGQGWGAYGQRFGSNLGYNAVRQTITQGVGLALHEAGRY